MYRDYIDQMNDQNKNTTTNLFTTTLRDFGTSIVSIDE